MAMAGRRWHAGDRGEGAGGGLTPVHWPVMARQLVHPSGQ